MSNIWGSGQLSTIQTQPCAQVQDSPVRRERDIENDPITRQHLYCIHERALVRGGATRALARSTLRRGTGEGVNESTAGCIFTGKGLYTHLMLDPQIFLTRRTPKQCIDILKRHVRSLWNPIRRPNVRGETRRGEDQERKTSNRSSQYRTATACGNRNHEAPDDSRSRSLKENRRHEPNQNYKGRKGQKWSVR